VMAKLNEKTVNSTKRLETNPKSISPSFSKRMKAVDFTKLSKKNDNFKKTIVVTKNGMSFNSLVMTKAEVLNSSNILYAHVHKTSRRCYIGITVMPARQRWAGGRGYLWGYFSAAINKYGWNGFSHHVLAFIKNSSDMNAAEIKAIRLAGGHKTNYTYNLTPGGDVVAENEKPIVGWNLKTGIKKKFKSGVAAAKFLQVKVSDMIGAVVRGKRSSTKGWFFAFAEDKSAHPPKLWGEALRVKRIEERFGSKVLAVHYKTGEKKAFTSQSAAAAALDVHQTAISHVILGKTLSAGGWFFSPEGKTRKLPLLYGAKATRKKRDRKIYAVNLITNQRRSFRNCSEADNTLELAAGSVSSVVTGSRASAGKWFFSYDPKLKPPSVYGGALVAKARSVAIEAENLKTGKVTRFASGKAASNVLGIHRSSISLVLNRKRKEVGGYAFRRVRSKK